MEKWYGNSWSSVIEELKSNTYTGLASSVIENRRSTYGENIVKLRREKKSKIKQIQGFIGLHSTLQIAIATIFIIDGKIMESIALYMGILLFYAFEFYNHSRRAHKFKQIEKLNIGRVKCIRNGNILVIDIVELVVGDIIMLEEGGVVPADIRVVESNDLYVRESSITGKDEIVEKYETRIYGEVHNLWELKNILFKSSLVVKGQCTGVVVAVGMETQIGKFIADTKMKGENDELTLTIKTVIRNFKYFALGIILAALIYSLLQSKSMLVSIEFVKLCLYSLYFNITILSGIMFCLYLKRNLKLKGIDFFNIFSMQKIGRISIIMLNDNGFLCEDEMRVKEIFTDETHASEFSTDLINEYNMERMMHIAILCNNASNINEVKQQNRKTYTGEDSEVSILKFANSMLFNKGELDFQNPRIFQIPMDSERKIMTTVNKIEEYFRANVKGESEEILKRCTHVMKNGLEVDITQSDIEIIKNNIIKMSNNALKVMGFAYRNFNYEPSIDENIESHLVFVGLIGMENSIKDNSVSNLKKCESLNIKTVLVTENNKLYAYALGRKLGMIKKVEEVLSGIELKYMSRDEQSRIIDKIKIFSNIFQDSKARLVGTLNTETETTAICVNHFSDLPALNEASVSIAYGKNCSNTVKRISDIFISDNSFYNIITLIKSCRANIININISLTYLISVTLSQIILIALQWLFLPYLNINYALISIINLFCIPLNIISILMFSRYNDESIERFYGSKLIIKLKIKVIIICCIQILLLLLTSLYLINELNILSSTFITFIIFSFAQIIVKKSFKKYEIYN